MQESLNKQAELDINKLLADTGHVIGACDLPALFELNRYANIISDKSEIHNTAILFAPVKCGKRWLTSPHIAGILWHDNHNAILAEANPAYAIMAQVLICDMDSEYYHQALRMDDQYEICLLLNEYADTVCANLIEISLSLHKLMPQDEGSGEAGGQSIQGMLGFMVREYGQTISYWLHDAPLQEIMILIDEYRSRIEAEYAHARKMSKKMDIKLPGIRNRFSEAIVGYRKTLKAITEGWSVSNV